MKPETYIERYRVALAANSEVLEKNRSIIKLNRPIREQNGKLRKLNAKITVENAQLRRMKQPIKALLRYLPLNHYHHVAPEHRQILDAESKAIRDQKQIEPGEWRRRVLTIINPAVRQQVACIVWWDHFGARLVADRWPDLDEWKDAPAVEVAPDALEYALRNVGYTPWQAYRRAKGEDCEQESMAS